MTTNLLEGTRAYLSGPMDFVGSRTIEKFLGWRSLLTPILKALGITVLDPWNKPMIKGHKDYAETACPGKDFYKYLENGTIVKTVSENLKTLEGK